ncbi:hypothetical protein JCGZ_20930 [Jatropha curcas]|uniref:EF-hand domain-containing protein n=1 Tax=Jatropha curcas TaxID=180498 RepID=A0A067LH55_JATCU|nr:hypothetical protein JCGZ_20930 [Jatropha curcas]
MEELKLKSPLIIAAIDDSKSNDTVAAKLASFLKYPLVDQNDITRALLNLITPTQLPDELTSNLPFETVCQITSTQLGLNINLVLNLVLSHSTHLKKLVELASSRKAHLIIMECGTQNNNNLGYDIERVPKIRVDKNSLDVQKIVSEMFILLEKKDKDDARETESLEKSNIRQPTNDHLHVLNFYEQQKNIEFECRRCSRPCDGTFYKCEDCDEFNLHKVCAESASKVRDCPPFLRSVKPNHYDFPKTYKCKNCQKFSFDCYDCLFGTHLSNEFLPTILHSRHHSHRLNLTVIPFRYNYQYLCNFCEKVGSSVSYKCYECNYDVHVDCILPEAIKTKNGKYIFGLISRNSDVAAAYNHCDICHQDIERGQLYYGCHEYDFEYVDIHCMCMPIESQAIDAIISRKMLIKQELRRHSLYKMNDETLRNILRKFDEDKDKIVSQAELRKTRHYIEYLDKW